MRVQMVNGASNGWVAGDPSYDVRSFSKAFGAAWPMVRKVVTACVAACKSIPIIYKYFNKIKILP